MNGELPDRRPGVPVLQSDWRRETRAVGLRAPEVSALLSSHVRACAVGAPGGLHCGRFWPHSQPPGGAQIPPPMSSHEGDWRDRRRQRSGLLPLCRQGAAVAFLHRAVDELWGARPRPYSTPRNHARQLHRDATVSHFPPQHRNGPNHAGCSALPALTFLPAKYSQR